jgi:hypothetical protein
MFVENQGTVSLPVKIDNPPSIEAPYSSGCIGLGTWNNSAEFKDLKVVLPNGKILFESDFSKKILITVEKPVWANGQSKMVC